MMNVLICMEKLIIISDATADSLKAIRLRSTVALTDAESKLFEHVIFYTRLVYRV